ncbi:hypothetical protein H0E87_018943 [Populus deltoides]|uniref:Uncharacterized protein n=1 Tax=Populus deltoides TaxID=3696 RepID=A0A8T2XUG2_POPDE|nr:hypothetical protein H0E87_018943 [Populus deltoides]
MDNLSGCQKWSPLDSCCWVDAEVPVSNGFHWISATKVLPKLLYLVPYNFGTAFHDGKKIQLPSFRDCLKEGGTVKKLAVGREAAIEVQDMKADEFLLFLAVTCEGTRVWCWGYTLLFTNFVSRLARVHDAFTWPTCATVSVSEQLHHLHATSPSQDNSYDVKRAKNNAWVIVRTPLMPLRGSAMASPVLVFPPSSLALPIAPPLWIGKNMLARDPLYFLNSEVQDRKKKNTSFLYNAMANPYISIKGNFVKINPS